MKKFTGMMMIAGLLMVFHGCSAPRPTDTIRESGDHRFKTGDFPGARDEYAEIVARYPGNWEDQYKLGVCLTKTNELAAARRALETAYTHKDANQDVADALAEVMFLQGDESRLFAFLRDRASKTQTVAAYLKLAHYSVAMSDPDSAKTAIDTAIQLDNGKSSEPYYQAALIAERLGDLDDAVLRLRQALGINPADVRIREKLKSLGEDLSRVTPMPPGR